MRREVELFSLFLLSGANLFSSSDSNSSNNSFEVIRSFVNIARNLARSLARYISINSFVIFVINKINRDEDSSVSLIEARSYCRVKS